MFRDVDDKSQQNFDKITKKSKRTPRTQKRYSQIKVHHNNKPQKKSRTPTRNQLNLIKITIEITKTDKFISRNKRPPRNQPIIIKKVNKKNLRTIKIARIPKRINVHAKRPKLTIRDSLKKR